MDERTIKNISDIADELCFMNVFNAFKVLLQNPKNVNRYGPMFEKFCEKYLNDVVYYPNGKDYEDEDL